VRLGTAEAEQPLVGGLDRSGLVSDLPGVKPRLKRQVTYFSLAVAAFGLLLWARLILVTGRPRAAIADPEKQAAAAKPDGASPSHPAGDQFYQP